MDTEDVFATLIVAIFAGIFGVPVEPVEDEVDAAA